MNQNKSRAQRLRFIEEKLLELKRDSGTPSEAQQIDRIMAELNKLRAIYIGLPQA